MMDAQLAFAAPPPVCALCKKEITGTPIVLRPENGDPARTFCPTCYWKQPNAGAKP